MILLNSLFPVFALIVLGNRLKRFRLTNETFLKTADKLVYFIFFPVMLFWKIGRGGSAVPVDWRFPLAAGLAVLTIYILSTLYVLIFRVGAFQVGTFSQTCYRFNTYVGMALMITMAGDEGVRLFGILISLLIPPINVLAVVTLIWFSGKTYSGWERMRLAAKAIVANPLILGCGAGLLYARFRIPMPAFIENTFELMSLLTLPLALLSIGGALSLKSLRGHLKLSMVGAVFKLVLLPLAGYLYLQWFGVTGLPFKIGMVFLCLPTSTALYVLSSQLNSDTELASASIVLSTILSFFSLSVALVL